MPVPKRDDAEQDEQRISIGVRIDDLANVVWPYEGCEAHLPNPSGVRARGHFPTPCPLPLGQAAENRDIIMSMVHWCHPVDVAERHSDVRVRRRLLTMN